MNRRSALIAGMSGYLAAGWCRSEAAEHAKARFTTFSKDVSALIELPVGKIDTGRAALSFAREIYPSVDIDACSLKIDAMAAHAGRLVGQYGRLNDPESTIRVLNSYYYRVWGVQYDNSPESRTRQENFFLHHTLETRRGSCVTIPMLYMAVAQRLGYPVYGVTAPEHSFVRFVDPRLKEQNIELSSQLWRAGNPEQGGMR